MGLVAVATGAVSTMAWFQASGAATINTPTATDEKTFGVDYESFGDSLGTVDVTVTFEEVGNSRVLGLASYGKLKTVTASGVQTFKEYGESGYAEFVAGNGETVSEGWHRAYVTPGGTTVWDAVEPPAGAYGQNANAYYRVYRIKAVTASITADQAATLPTNHRITGNVKFKTGSAASFLFWKQDSALAADNSGTPTGDLNADAKAFTAIDFTGHWSQGANTVYSDTYIGVLCSGRLQTTNADVSATLQFDSVAVVA